MLNNDAKELDFLPQNRLIFAFQQNIINNPKFSEYKIWFEFAETTRNHKNVEEDFDKFKKNETLMAVLERIKVDNFNEEDRSILDEWENDFIRLEEYRWDIEREGIRKAQEADRKAQEAIKEAEIESIQKTERTVILSFERGLDRQLISEITQLTIEEVNEIIKRHKS